MDDDDDLDKLMDEGAKDLDKKITSDPPKAAPKM
jgi:hypothetical protein